MTCFDKGNPLKYKRNFICVIDLELAIHLSLNQFKLCSLIPIRVIFNKPNLV